MKVLLSGQNIIFPHYASNQIFREGNSIFGQLKTEKQGRVVYKVFLHMQSVPPGKMFICFF